MSHYLVTGCAGFIGAKVTELLLAAGHAVTGVDNLNDAYDVRLKQWRLAQIQDQPHFRLHRVDIVDRAALEQVFTDHAARTTAPFAAIINLAARAGVRQSVENPWVYIDTNTTGTLNLLELARQYDVPKFVLSSTSSLYGQHNPMPYREDADTNRPLSPYAATKKAAEALCYTYHYLYGLDVTVFRYFTVYGPGGRPDMSLFRFVQWVSEGRPVVVFGDGSQSRDFTYVDDIARGTIAGLRPVGYEIINLGSDQPVVLRDALRLIEQRVGRPAQIDFRPMHRADVLATWADIGKAEQLLGWRPQVPTADGIARLVDWYQANRNWAQRDCHRLTTDSCCVLRVPCHLAHGTRNTQHATRRRISSHPMSKQIDMLRFTTAGSVDDGKSTLIGRLLLDSKAIMADQMAAIERASRQRGDPYLDLALLTDGLRAEREQGITIDVAYRYFATPKRKFIIADTPGHIQYTRNMITGAATAELAIVLIDVRKGVLTQSKRHGFLASLLQIPHILVAVNKMDLVGYAAEAFQAIVDEYRAFASKLTVQDISYIPISALVGDNVVHKSANMPWYEGPTLLHQLENVTVGSSRNLVDFRFPVQLALRPHQDFRGFAGQVASGSITPGEEIVVLPSGRTSRVRAIVTMTGELPEAAAGDSVILTLEDEIDISRGDMLVRRHNLPQTANQFECILCWMDEEPLKLQNTYLLQHTTRQVRASVSELNYRIDVDTLHRNPAHTLQLNEIGRVKITTTQPLFYDPYQLNRATGGFILIDPYTNNTVAAGMIRRQAQELEDIVSQEGTRQRSTNVVWESTAITRGLREERNRHQAAVLWFTGSPAPASRRWRGCWSAGSLPPGCRPSTWTGTTSATGSTAIWAFLLRTARRISAGWLKWRNWPSTMG